MNARPLHFLLLLLSIVVLPTTLSAHEAIMVADEAGEIVVTNPEVGRVYLGELSDGASASYRITADAPWDLYLSLLVPRRSNPLGKYDAMVYDVGRERMVAVLERGDGAWYPYYELFGADRYFRGPMLLKQMPEGEFRIIVTGPQNIGRYALVIGEEEVLSLGQIFVSISKMAGIKKDFFDVSPAMLLLSPLALSYLLLLLSLGALIGRAGRFGASFFKIKDSTRRDKNNINRRGAWIRYFLGFLTLLVGIFTTWNPVLFVVSGFLFYESFASWCGIMAIVGKRK